MPFPVPNPIASVIVLLCLLLPCLEGALGGKKQTGATKDLVPYPDLFIIGAQKCGTTSLNNLLFEHKEICSKGVKEKHFYSESKYADMVKDYMAEYVGCKPNQVTVDATPKYVVGSEVAERIKASYKPETLAKKKFVLLLRDPVARQYSEYQRVLRICFRVIEGDKQLQRVSTTRTPEEKVERAEKNCGLVMRPAKKGGKSPPLKKENAMTFEEWAVSPFGSYEQARGNYVHQIKHWLSVIKRSQLFILNFQSLISNTSDSMQRLSTFLNIDYQGFLDTAGNADKTKVVLPQPPPSNTYVDWAPAFMDCRTHDTLFEYYKQQNEGLYSLINDAEDRPAQEPFFPAFTSARSKCKNALMQGNNTDAKVDFNVSSQVIELTRNSNSTQSSHVRLV